MNDDLCRSYDASMAKRTVLGSALRQHVLCSGISVIVHSQKLKYTTKQKTNQRVKLYHYPWQYNKQFLKLKKISTHDYQYTAIIKLLAL
jgi:hypothetical protein